MKIHKEILPRPRPPSGAVRVDENAYDGLRLRNHGFFFRPVTICDRRIIDTHVHPSTSIASHSDRLLCQLTAPTFFLVRTKEKAMSSDSEGAAAAIREAKNSVRKEVEAMRRELAAERAARKPGKVDTSWRAAFKAVALEFLPFK